MRTAVAKSGFQTTGSVLDAIADRAGDVEEDAQDILIQSKINADAYNDKARNQILQIHQVHMALQNRPILRYLLLWNPLTANLLSNCYCVTLYPC
jgi:hypothetical protein